MSFHPLSSFHSTKAAFGRAVGPLLIAGSVGLAGCTTVKTSQLNWDTCDLTDSTSKILGIPDLDVKGGEGVAGIITGLNLKASYNNVQPDQLCPVAKRIIRSTVIPEGNGYNSAGLAVLIAFYTNPENDIRLKSLVASRMEQEFGFSPQDVIEISRKHVEKQKEQAASAEPVCKVENGRRICNFDPK